MLTTLAICLAYLAAAAFIANRLLPDTPQAPPPGQAAQRGAADVRDAFLAQTKEAQELDLGLKLAERMGLIARKMADGTMSDRLTVSLSRLPADAQGFIHTVAANRGQLLQVASLPSEALRDHLLGIQPVPGLPSLADGAEAHRRGCEVIHLDAARRVQAWQSGGRTLDPHPDALRRRRVKGRRKSA